jgi:hypothetical protein
MSNIWRNIRCCKVLCHTATKAPDRGRSAQHSRHYKQTKKRETFVSLFKYPDKSFLERIFRGFGKDLGVMPEECLYVGDGGSYELESALSFGMHPVQAVWYLKD